MAWHQVSLSDSVTSGTDKNFLFCDFHPSDDKKNFHLMKSSAKLFNRVEQKRPLNFFRFQTGPDEIEPIEFRVEKLLGLKLDSDALYSKLEVSSTPQNYRRVFLI